VWIWNLARSDYLWPNWAKAIKRLGETILTTTNVGHLPGTRRDIVANCITEDIVRCVLYGDVLHIPGDDEAELVFVVNIWCLDRHDDWRERPSNAGLGLVEQDWKFGQCELELLTSSEGSEVTSQDLGLTLASFACAL
jgi:hypothetical protein